jgi:YD repeat-containing protein
VPSGHITGYAGVQENPANRLVEVQENSVTVAEYTYDGDGNRVKSVVYGASETVTTYYVGTYYEKSVTVDGGGTTTAWKKYYYAGAVRLAIPRRCASGTLCGRMGTPPST